MTSSGYTSGQDSKEFKKMGATALFSATAPRDMVKGIYFYESTG